MLPTLSWTEFAPTVTTRFPLFPEVVNVPVQTLPALAKSVLAVRLPGFVPPSTVISAAGSKPVTTSVNSKVASIVAPAALNAAGASVIPSPGASASTVKVAVCAVPSGLSWWSSTTFASTRTV